MTPVELLAELRRCGVRLWVDGEVLRYRDPKGALMVELLPMLRRHKPALMAFLRGGEPAEHAPGGSRTPFGRTSEPVPGPTPRKPAPPGAGGPLSPTDQRVGATVVGGIAASWAGRVAEGENPPQFDRAIEQTVRRLDADVLFELALETASPELDRAACTAEVHARARGMVECAEARGSAPASRVGDGACSYPDHARWRSVHGVLVCGECHPPASPGLVAEWLRKPAAGPPTEDSG